MDNWQDAPVNMSELMQEFSEDLASVKNLLNDLILNINDQLGIIEEALINTEFDILLTQAQSILEAATRLKADSLVKSCREFENYARANEITACTESFALIKEQFAQIAQFAEKL